ncbi:MAG: deoxyhypusine synthase [Candidatus Hydrogenedens sp.]|nr:deoxyhypusine synthase [Candidatus Hydrogenedens sp.]
MTSDREFHDGREDGLAPLVSLDLEQVRSFADLVRAMERTAFGGRQLGRALEILLAMARDPDCAVVMTLSGAMTVAKQGRIMCDMIDRGIIDAVVSTGALMAHGLTESLGLVHYAVNPEADDTELFEKGYNRVYDTLEMESNLNTVEAVVASVLRNHQPEDGQWSSARFCQAVGAELDRMDEGPGVLRSAFRKNVPVFVPAFTDSEIGLDFATHAMRLAQESGQLPKSGPVDPQVMFNAVPQFNPFLDLQQYARLIGAKKRIGIFTIGGGVPRNWAQQVSPFFDITSFRLDVELPEVRFQYGVRICPEPVHWGGLSGCTYSEGVSWGKFVPESEGGRFAEVYSDATLVWPLLAKALFEELDKPAS